MRRARTALALAVLAIAPQAAPGEIPGATLILEAAVGLPGRIPAAAPPRFVLLRDRQVFVGGSEAIYAGQLSKNEVKRIEKRVKRLRKAGLLQVRTEQGGELLDAGASDAFAVADHQIAHVYVHASDQLHRVKSLCNEVQGVDLVLDRHEQKTHAIDHERSGDLVLVAESRRWFSYDYWLDDSRAPDFAHTVDIHRKPGYDPCELFIDPKLSVPKLRIAWKLLRKRLGFRTLMDVIPLDPSLVRGSHGRVDVPPPLQPVLIAQHNPTDRAQEIPCPAVRDIILQHLFER